MILLILSFHAAEIKIKGILVFVVVFFYGVLILIFKPYKNHHHNRIDQVATYVGGITVILGVFMYNNKFDSWVYFGLIFMGIINGVFVAYIIFKIIQAIYISSNIEEKLLPKLPKMGKIGKKLERIIKEKKQKKLAIHDKWELVKDRVRLYIDIK